MSAPWAALANGVLLTVRVTPNASRTGAAGLAMTSNGRSAMAIRLRAPPVDGAANKALLDFLAKLLAVRKSDLSIVTGQSGRIKTIRIAGDPGSIVSRLEETTSKATYV